jgi:hypothetical protein
LLATSSAFAEDAKVQTASDHISVFNVSLVCPAAPEIGCGYRSKPALLELQRQPSIAEAWLNASGTVLAVVGTKGSMRESRVKTVQSILGENGISATELTGDDRDVELKDFASRHDWYHGSEVDSLTKQEAAIIAARWVHRMERNVTLSEANAKALETELTQVISDGVIANTDVEKQEFAQELTKVARKNLDEKGVCGLPGRHGQGLSPTTRRQRRNEKPNPRLLLGQLRPLRGVWCPFVLTNSFNV